MRWKLMVVPVLALFFACVAPPARSQAAHSAEVGKLPLTIGVGFSNFSDDWGTPNARQNGITLWADWKLRYVPPVLQGLGIEFEGRDISWNTPSYLGNHRMDTALGGPKYEWRFLGPVRPFAKYLMGVGSISITNPNDPGYQHDTRTVFAPAGGLEFQFSRRFLIRAEYEYQSWHDIFGRDSLNPQGVTIGCVYDFGQHTNY